MSTLIAIGYPDETTATAAGDEAERLAKDLIIQPDAIAVIRRDVNGHFHVTTNHHSVAGGTTYGMFWGLLFGMLFFIPESLSEGCVPSLPASWRPAGFN